MTKKWKRGDPSPFKRILNIFIEYLEKQDKLVTAEDLLPHMLYNYIWSIDGIHTTRCILSRGILVPEGFDSQINVEFQPFNGGGKVEVEIYHHKEGLPLTEGWKKAGPIDSKTMMKYLFS